MADESRDTEPQAAARESYLVPAMLAIALAVAAQLALRDGLTVLGLAGYCVAAWLFVSSVRAIFDAPPVEKPSPATGQSAPAELDASPVMRRDEPSRLRFLRQHWRLVTMAEIFSGDIPPARLLAADLVDEDVDLASESEVAPETDQEAVPAPEPIAEDAPVGPPVVAAQMRSWAAADGAADSASSAPKAVKVTPQGDVLVLDAGLEQVQRFDEQGNLLVTYSLAGLAGIELLDLDVSPDGQTLYIVDAASGRLRVITLDDDADAKLEEE